MREVFGVLGALGIAAGIVGGLVLAGLLAWAPMQLYAIRRQLERLNETTDTQTKLLAALANAAYPMTTCGRCGAAIEKKDGECPNCGGLILRG